MRMPAEMEMEKKRNDMIAYAVDHLPIIKFSLILGLTPGRGERMLCLTRKQQEAAYLPT